MRIPGLLLALALAAPSDAGEPLTMGLAPAAAMAPAVLTVRAIVETDGDNRALQIVAQSADFYRSSLIELSGADAPRLNAFQFKGLPAGTYQVTSTLVGTTGDRASVSRMFLVARLGGELP